MRSPPTFPQTHPPIQKIESYPRPNIRLRLWISIYLWTQMGRNGFDSPPQLPRWLLCGNRILEFGDCRRRKAAELGRTLKIANLRSQTHSYFNYWILRQGIHTYICMIKKRNRDDLMINGRVSLSLVSLSFKPWELKRLRCGRSCKLNPARSDSSRPEGTATPWVTLWSG